jgi:hypothetical protein
METSKDFAVFELPGSLKLLFNQGAWRECGASNFFVIIILFIFVFYHGKLGMQNAGLKKMFAMFLFSQFFPRDFFIIHQFYLCSKAQARLWYNKGHFIKLLIVHLEKWLMPPLHVAQILLKCAPSFGWSPVWVQLEDLPVHFEKNFAGISPQRICIQSLWKY